MRFPSRYALFVAAPLSLWVSGCAGGARVARHDAPSDAARRPGRLTAMAQVYEQKGDLQQAYRLYNQALATSPSNPELQQRIDALVASMQSESHGDSSLDAAGVVATGGSRRAELLTDEEVLARVPAPRKKPKVESGATESLASRSTSQESPSEFSLFGAPDAAGAAPSSSDDPLLAASLLPELPAPPASGLQREFIPLLAPGEQDGGTKAWGDTEPPAELQETPALVELAPTSEETGAGADEGWRPTTPRCAGGPCAEGADPVAEGIAQLASADPEERKSALELLALHGRDAASAAPAVRELLNDDDLGVQAYAAWALWELTGEADEAMSALQFVLATAIDEDASAFGCYVLGSMGAEAAPACELLATIRDESGSIVRIHAAEALLRITPDDAVSLKTLTDALASEQPQERALAAVALNAAEAHKEQAVQSLINALQDGDGVVRASAALTLGGFGAEAQAALAPLQQAAATADAETREAVATALACIPAAE